MKHKREESKLREFISGLMNGSNEEEVLEAESRFLSYLRLVKSIQQRINAEKDLDA